MVAVANISQVATTGSMVNMTRLQAELKIEHEDRDQGLGPSKADVR